MPESLLESELFDCERHGCRMTVVAGSDNRQVKQLG